jgi:hypothetical protein
MYLETPKGQEGGVELDVINLKTLRGLLAAGASGRKPAASKRRAPAKSRVARRRKPGDEK